MEFNLLHFYLVFSWVFLGALMWSDWYEDIKPINYLVAILILIMYIIFMPVMWLSRIGRK